MHQPNGGQDERSQLDAMHDCAFFAYSSLEMYTYGCRNPPGEALSLYCVCPGGPGLDVIVSSASHVHLLFSRLTLCPYKEHLGKAATS